MYYLCAGFFVFNQRRDPGDIFLHYYTISETNLNNSVRLARQYSALFDILIVTDIYTPHEISAYQYFQYSYINCHYCKCVM